MTLSSTTQDVRNGSSVNGNGNAADAKPAHILIIGAGLTGLLLAQGIKKLNAELEAQGKPHKYTYSIYERDETQFYRGGGFSLTIHWALPRMRDILPEELSSRIFDCVGNPSAMKRGDLGSFTFLNLRTGGTVHRVPVPQGWVGARMSRVKVINLLMEGLEVNYSKRLSEVAFPDDDTVSATFTDGSQAVGDLMVGADGSQSVVRRFLYGVENSRNTQLPVRMINTRIEYPAELVQKCLDIDSHTFHGGDPVQNGYFFFALVDMPPPESENKNMVVQLTISWPYEPGYLGEKEGTEPPTGHLERLAWLRRIAEHWADPMGKMIREIPEESTVVAVNIAEWLPNDDIPHRRDPRVTTVGDAAHLMTSFRGENANHGVADIANLVDLLRDQSSLKDVVPIYEEEMIGRTRPATLKAHQACIDANYFINMKSGSQFLQRRQTQDHEEKDVLAQAVSQNS